MRSRIEPLSSVDRDEITDYLARAGHSRAIINWKYFDPSFNRDRERGYVYFQDGKISGFIGLLPFCIRTKGALQKAAWTCDWYRDAGATGAMGLMLIKSCFRSYNLLYSSGGSPVTQQILTRIATRTVERGETVLHKPLRAAALLSRLGVTLPHLGRLPLPPALSREASRGDAVITASISDKIYPLLADNGTEPAAAYGPEYVAWQIGRCPSVTSGTCYVERTGVVSAGAVFWRVHGDKGYWRMALWARRDALRDAKAVISAVTHHAFVNGANMLSVMASRLDLSLLKTFRSNGFILRQHRPVYILRSTSLVEAEELSGLSFLDTDVAYR